MSRDIMIDLETLGTSADAIILSIGAALFGRVCKINLDGHSAKGGAA